MDSFLDKRVTARTAVLARITVPAEEMPVDEGLVLWFPGPNSFTGEDCLEFQVHGGRAVVRCLIAGLCKLTGTRMAEAGEFSRRAFENGRLDLTALEGLSDLVAADTEYQRKLAYRQSQGSLREVYDGWRSRLVRIRALMEAKLDFSDEEDVPDNGFGTELKSVTNLVTDMRAHLDDRNAGEIIRDGFQIALMGLPNAGKSSLINSLAQRDVAIVTEEAGTTRDLLSVHLDVGGYAVTLFDTAGLRSSENAAEIEGVKRAEKAGKSANLVIWLQDINAGNEIEKQNFDNVLYITSKDDAGLLSSGQSVSAKTGHGISDLISRIRSEIEESVGFGEATLVSRARHRDALERCLLDLERCLLLPIEKSELQAELLRSAGDYLGRITGRIDVEDLLDTIFSEFCIGK